MTPTGRALVSLTPTLKTGVFADPDAGDRHAETRWQIVQGTNSLIVLDVTSEQELTQSIVPSLILEENTEYYWRAIFYDQRGQRLGVVRGSLVHDRLQPHRQQRQRDTGRPGDPGR